MYSEAYCGPIGVLNREVSLYRAAYCGANGVLNREVSLYRAAYCGPNGVLTVVPMVSLRFQCTYVLMYMYIHTCCTLAN